MGVIIKTSKRQVTPPKISLPYRYKPYPHQKELMRTFWAMLKGESDIKHYGLEWHRRGGKDMTFWQLVVAAAILDPGDYAYCLPTNVQAKKVIWNGNVNDYKGEVCKFFDFIPPSMPHEANKSDSMITLANGSNIYVIGSDNFNNLVGMNLKGVVYSEWSLCNPEAPKYIQPMLNATNGWSLYCWTPRGKNHAWKTREIARVSEDWYFSSLTILDTSKSDGSRIITPEKVEADIANGITDYDTAQQEYYLDYDAIVKGIVYSKYMARAREENRVRDLYDDGTYNPNLPVMTFWDIGKSDATCIWFVQKHPKTKQLNCIHYFEDCDEGISYYLEYLEEVKSRLKFKRYGKVYLPHDGSHQTFAADAQSVLAQFRKAHYDAQLIPRTPTLQSGIDRTKSIFHEINFDIKECSGGLIALDNYKWKLDKDGNSRGQHVHDHYSNGADALRQMGQLFGKLPDEETDRQLAAVQEYYDNNSNNMSYNFRY